MLDYTSIYIMRIERACMCVCVCVFACARVRVCMWEPMGVALTQRSYVCIVSVLVILGMYGCVTPLRKRLKLKYTDRNITYLQKGRRMELDICHTFVHAMTCRLPPVEPGRTPLNASSAVNITRLSNILP